MKSIRLLRAILGISQQTLVEESGISRASISAFESGRSFPSVETAKLLDSSIDGIIDKRVMAAVEQERRRRAEEESPAAGSHVDNARKPDYCVQMGKTKGGLDTERLRAALIEEAALAGVTPVQLAKQLTTEPPQKTISFRPSAGLRAAIDQEAERTQTSAGQVCKAWLEERVSPPKEETEGKGRPNGSDEL
jgi:transcriptional regulator with XRE-family HTH domain